MLGEVIVSDNVDYETLVDDFLIFHPTANVGASLDSYTDAGVYMINYRASDTPATDWGGQVGILINFRGYYARNTGSQTSYNLQLFGVTQGDTVYRLYARQFTINGSGTPQPFSRWIKIGGS